jgi:hypothetical protein
LLMPIAGVARYAICQGSNAIIVMCTHTHTHTAEAPTDFLKLATGRWACVCVCVCVCGRVFVFVRVCITYIYRRGKGATSPHTYARAAPNKCTYHEPREEQNGTSAVALTLARGGKMLRHLTPRCIPSNATVWHVNARNARLCNRPCFESRSPGKSKRIHTDP